MFSATIPKDIATLANRYQRHALRIATAAPHDLHRDIEYRAVEVVARERDLAVVNLLRFHDAPGALVFCATRERVTHLAANLHERGFAAVALSGELSQRERNQALQALRDGRARVCVATDVAARGLDLPDLGLVIHADVPMNAQVLVHRSGRTGRAGKHGVAILVVPTPARRHVERLVATAHVEVAWSAPPSAQDIRRRDHEQLVAEIGTRAEAPSEDDRLVARELLAAHSAEDLVGELVRLRREARPAPEDLTPPTRARPARASARPADQRYTWFTINVGRSRNSDPKWLIPMLCRRGNITRRAIGKIQIHARDTRVEIANDAVESFAAALRRPDDKDRHVHVERCDAPS
jgi:ATP-dependent RNA helicase DeaD